MTSFTRTFGATQFDGVDEAPVLDAELFTLLDPAHEKMLAWAKTTIASELNAKGWEKATNGTVLEGRAPVETSLSFEPEPNYLKQAKTAFPLLYCYPRQGQSRGLTLELESIETTWRFGYVLGQLAIEDRTRLLPALRMFPKLIGLMFGERAHPDHDGGADQWDTGKVDFASVRLLRHEYGAAQFGDQGDGAPFYVAELELLTTEIEGFLDVYPVLSGFDIYAKGDGQPGLIDGTVDL
jgi:hypothetical protein